MAPTAKPRHKIQSTSRKRLPVDHASPITSTASFRGTSASWICLFLATASLIAYSRCLWNGFINYDDPQYIIGNSQLQGGLSRETLRWAFTTFEAGNWHPLTWISHALDIQMFGLVPTGHHFVSILFHALNAVLLLLLLWKATGSGGRSLVVAAMFALHPLNVECVAWAAERKSLLSTLFFFLALGAYGWFARKPSLGRYGTMALLYALGLMAKPMVITLPFLLMLLDYWPLQRIELWTPPRESWRLSRKAPLALFAEKIPLLLLSAASAAITLAAQRGAIVPFSAEPFSWRVVNALNAYALYLFKSVWPVGLALFYPRRPPILWQVVISSGLLLAITVWAWRDRKAHPYLLPGWLWYLGTLVPVIGLVEVGSQAMADRYSYIPLLGIFVMVVWRVSDAAQARALPIRFQRAVTAAILLALAVLTWHQTGFWQNPLSVWTHTLQVSHDNAVAEDNLGTALIDLGRDDEAIAHFRSAIRIQPGEPKVRLVLGSLLMKRGELQAAIDQYQTALSLKTDRDDLVAIYTSLGVAYRQSGDYNAASESFRQLLQLDPSNMQVIMALGRVQMLKAADLQARELGRHPTAEGFVQLGILWERAGEIEQATHAYQAGLTLNSKLAVARDGLDRLAKNHP